MRYTLRLRELYGEAADPWMTAVGYCHHPGVGSKPAWDSRPRCHLIEPSQEAGGNVKFDGFDRIRARLPRAGAYYWPLLRRPRGETGHYGAMHVKCLIADRKKALVSSANLTDYALEKNMELGLLVYGPVAIRLAEHFDQLIIRGELAAVEGSPA